MEPPLGHRVRVDPAHRQVVPRRADQRQRELRRPARPHRPAQQGGPHLGGRARRPAHPHLLGPLPGREPLRERPPRPRGREGRPGRGVPADDPRVAHHPARVRPHRGRAQRGLRRLQRRVAARPHQRHAGQGGGDRRRRLPPGRGHPPQADHRRRPRRRPQRRVGGGDAPRGARRRHRHAGRPRPLVPRPHGEGGAALRPAADGLRGPPLHPLHVGHHRQAQGHRPRHRRLPRRHLRHLEVGVRPEGGGRLLLHRRHRLGHRPQLPRLRAPRQRGHLRHVRGRARHPPSGPVLGDGRALRGHRVLHRPRPPSARS